MSPARVMDHVQSLYKLGRWAEAYAVLEARLGQERDGRAGARLKVLLVEGYNHESWKHGLRRPERKHALLDEAESAAVSAGDDILLADALYERGMALHIDFVMRTSDPERERESFTRSAALRDAAGDAGGAAMALGMLGIYHHVVRLDRGAAEPLLREAHERARAAGHGWAQSESARHLGQIAQELGDSQRALHLLQESLELRVATGWEIYVPDGLLAVASARLDAGDLEGAAADLARARELSERDGHIFALAMIARVEADLEFARLAPGVWNRRHP